MAVFKKFRIKSFKEVNSIIEFENVSLAYGERLILDKEAGEIGESPEKYEFKSINDSLKSHDDQIILDCWRIFDSNHFKKIKYERLGQRSHLV